MSRENARCSVIDFCTSLDAEFMASQPIFHLQPFHRFFSNFFKIIFSFAGYRSLSWIKLEGESAAHIFFFQHQKRIKCYFRLQGCSSRKWMLFPLFKVFWGRKAFQKLNQILDARAAKGLWHGWMGGGQRTSWMPCRRRRWALVWRCTNCSSRRSLCSCCRSSKIRARTRRLLTARAQFNLHTFQQVWLWPTEAKCWSSDKKKVLWSFQYGSSCLSWFSVPSTVESLM